MRLEAKFGFGGEQPGRHATSRTNTFLWEVAYTFTHPLGSATVRSRPLAAKADPGAYSTFIPTARPWHRDAFTPRRLGRRPRGPANVQRGAVTLCRASSLPSRSPACPQARPRPAFFRLLSARTATWREIRDEHGRAIRILPSTPRAPTRRSHMCCLPECRRKRAR